MTDTTLFSFSLLIVFVWGALVANHFFLSDSKTYPQSHGMAFVVFLIGTIINIKYLDYIFPLLSTFGLLANLKTIPYFFLGIHFERNTHVQNFSIGRDVIFFDGYCGLCNHTVTLLIKLDKNKILRYSSLQGNYAKEVLDSDHIELDPSLIFRREGISYEKAEAVLHILRKLGGIYKFMGFLLKLFPIFILNKIYDLVARNRYYFFGKNDSCFVPNEEHKKLFIP